MIRDLTASKQAEQELRRCRGLRKEKQADEAQEGGCQESRESASMKSSGKPRIEKR